MYTTTAFLAVLYAAAVSAASLSTTESRSIARRGLSDVCLRSCGDNGSRQWPRFWECHCNAGFGGRCCSDCEVDPVTTVALDLDEWTRATWYVQKQQVNGYQPADSLFCVAATYSLLGTKVPLFNGVVIDVSNYGNKGGVNGEVTGGTAMPNICGRVTDVPGKLEVAPCFLPNIAAGPYWVLGVGVTDGKYDWAVIIGGQPTAFADGGCTTKATGINGSGLWLFSRTPQAPGEQIVAMEAVLAQQGVSKALLIDVPQAGCRYDGALIRD